MTLRWLVAGTLAVALFTGCRSASARWTSSPRAAPDPERWDRIACSLGEYPVELDGRALAWARMDDLRARQRGSATALAAERIAGERNAFDARCAAWRGATTSAAIRESSAPTADERRTSL